MMTLSQKSALLWLRNRGGDGGFSRNQVLLSSGEAAPVMRKTWNVLEGEGVVEFYQGRRRVRVTDKGMAADLSGILESQPREDF